MGTISRPLFIAFLFLFCFGKAYLSESWTMMSSDKPNVPKCVQIPANLSICNGIQYSEMRLPNLLEHETINEVVHSARDWENLIRLNCHPDTQLFLCSIYAPICLDKEILPCKSLCEAVQSGCEPRMTVYGFPWPEMLSCEKYPADNDMCIQAVNSMKERAADCPSCTQVGTYENLIDHFCRSTVVFKGKLSDVSGKSVRIRSGRSLKKGDRRRSLGDMIVHFASSKEDCPCNIEDGDDKRYLIMANRDSTGEYVANLITPWKKDKNFKRAIHQFQRLNCHSLGREIRESASRRPHVYHMRTHNNRRKRV